jgi:hypothetical protein
MKIDSTGATFMAEFKDKKFIKQTVILDGNTFDKCEFQGCTLVYNGISDVRLNGSTLNECQWTFDGPAARTLQFMQALYQSGGGGRDLMAETFRRFAAGTSTPTSAASANALN